MTIDPSVHKLVYAPNAVLNTPSQHFSDMEDNFEHRAEISKYLKDVMVHHQGVGLAGNQINLPLAVFAQTLGTEIVSMFDPQVLEVSEDKVLMTEGCLSEPGLFLKIKRPESVKVRWLPENSNEWQHDVLEGMDARIFLHEFDHINGIMFTDRVGDTKLKMARKKQAKRFSNAMDRIAQDLVT